MWDFAPVYQIDERRDIMLWALQQGDPDNWLLLDDGIKHQTMLQWIERCDFEFKPLLDRYKYFERYQEGSQEEYRHQAEQFLQQLENHLSRHDFLMDEKMRFVDVAIFPFVRQFAGVDRDWFEQCSYSKVRQWLAKCINSAVFQVLSH